jgi:hypothetical protein
MNVPFVECPPPSNCSVPVCTETVPVLVKGAKMKVVPVVNVCLSVPALSNAILPSPE